MRGWDGGTCSQSQSKVLGFTMPRTLGGREWDRTRLWTGAWIPGRGTHDGAFWVDLAILKWILGIWGQGRTKASKECKWTWKPRRVMSQPHRFLLTFHVIWADWRTHSPLSLPRHHSARSLWEERSIIQVSSVNSINGFGAQHRASCLGWFMSFRKTLFLFSMKSAVVMRQN